MAAAGGDTVVPTNWTGLILTAIAIALVAGATYFGFGMVLGDADGPKEESQNETSLQELYSSSARRGIEAMETVRALPRTALAPAESLSPPAPAGMSDAADMDDADAEMAAEHATDDAEESELARAAAAARDEAARMADAAAEKAARLAEEAEEQARAIAAKAEEQAREMAAQAEQQSRVAAEQAAAKARALKDAAGQKVAQAGAALDTRYRATTTALRAWWNDLNDSGLGIRFIGPLDSSVAENGLAVLFDQPVDASTAASFITLQSAAGNTVSADWKNGQNPNLIYAAGLRSGRYTLELESGLPSSNGHSLSKTIAGDAFVN